MQPCYLYFCFFTSFFFLFWVVKDFSYTQVFIACETVIQTWFVYIIFLLLHTSFGLRSWELGKELYMQVLSFGKRNPVQE